MKFNIFLSYITQLCVQFPYSVATYYNELRYSLPIAITWLCFVKSNCDVFFNSAIVVIKTGMTRGCPSLFSRGIDDGLPGDVFCSRWHIFVRYFHVVDIFFRSIRRERSAVAFVLVVVHVRAIFTRVHVIFSIPR